MTSPSAPSRNDPAPAPANLTEILRDCRTLYLKSLGQLLREAEPCPNQSVEAFIDTVGSYFDEMAAPQRRSGFDDAKGLTASRISLVGDNDLELEIRLGEFSSRLQETTGGDLWRVYLRFVTLLDRPELSSADNPVGPKGIALGLNELSATLGESHDKMLDRVDRLERYFAQNLVVLYATLNNFLADRQVASSQPSIIAARETAAVPPPSRNGDNPVAALQKNLLGQLGESAATGGGGGGGGEGNTGGAAASLFSQAMFDRLLARLDELEKSGPLGGSITTPVLNGSPSLESLIPGLFDAAPPSPANEEILPPRSLHSSELGVPIGAPEAVTIDTLALIFEAIFESDTLPDAAKTALSSLQIPTLRAAMLDPSFFTADAHPARQLLDRMARAVLGLPRDVPPTHPLCVSLRGIAAQVRADFTTDPQVFERQIGELSGLIADRDAAIARAAMAYLPLLHQVDRRSKTDAFCRQIIEKYCERGIPESVASFLRQRWQKVLLAVYLESGESSSAWQTHTTVIDHLLWSIQAKTELEDRKQLAKMLPSMLQLLNAGMARIGMADSAKTAFLDICFALQTAALRGTSPPPEASRPATKGSGETPPPAVTVLELESGSLLLKIVDFAAPPSAGRLRPPVNSVGDWLSFHLDDDHLLCGRLCQISPDTARLLLLNPDWGFAVALHPTVLEQQLKDGKARCCSADSLFNNAAEEALQNTVPL